MTPKAKHDNTTARCCLPARRRNHHFEQVARGNEGIRQDTFEYLDKNKLQRASNKPPCQALFVGATARASEGATGSRVNIDEALVALVRELARQAYRDVPRATAFTTLNGGLCESDT